MGINKIYPIEYPILVVSDIHLTDRKLPGYSNFSTSVRLVEYQYLYGIMEKAIKKYKCKSLVICGDILDSSMGVSIPTLIDLIIGFKKFNLPIHIVGGNHEFSEKTKEPTNSMALLLTLLDNVCLYNDVTFVESNGNTFLMLPYYVDKAICKEAFKNLDVEIMFSHKDVEGFSKYPEEDWMIDSSMLQNCSIKWIVNGHLHRALFSSKFKEDCTYLQLGAPYQIRRSDNYLHNNFIYVALTSTEIKKIPINITAYTIAPGEVEGLLEKYQIVKLLLKYKIGDSKFFELEKKFMAMNRVVLIEDLELHSLEMVEKESNYQEQVDVSKIAEDLCKELKLDAGLKREIMDVICAVKVVEGNKFQVVV